MSLGEEFALVLHPDHPELMALRARCTKTMRNHPFPTVYEPVELHIGCAVIMLTIIVSRSGCVLFTLTGARALEPAHRRDAKAPPPAPSSALGLVRDFTARLP